MKRRTFVASVGAPLTALNATPVTLEVPLNSGELHTPSLSPDQCTLWYSQSGAIFSAPRR